MDHHVDPSIKEGLKALLHQTFAELLLPTSIASLQLIKEKNARSCFVSSNFKSFFVMYFEIFILFIVPFCQKRRQKVAALNLIVDTLHIKTH